MTGYVFYSPNEVLGNFGPCSLAIGNFDGVHVGHQALLRAAIGFVSQNSLRPAVLTFHPHPATIVAPERAPQFLCSLEERIRLLQSAGISRILVLPFTEAIARLSPYEFVSQILVKILNTRAVFVGENFRFGHKQSGVPATLRSLGREFGFVSQFLPPVALRGEVVSSSAIRSHIRSGNVVRAGRLLGRCFSLTGPVVSGDGIGSKQTVPTLNLRVDPGLAVPRGVFVTETTEIDTGQHWNSITNCGVRPTFGGEELTVETFLLDSLEGTPPRNIHVRFAHFLRTEHKFPDPAALKQQILIDVARARAYWQHRRALKPTLY